MFEILVRYSGIENKHRVLCFTNTQEESAPVHNKCEGDKRESCAEYNRRVVAKVAIEQDWCASCAQFMVSGMVVKGCDQCWDDLYRKYHDGHTTGYSLKDPDWVPFQGEEMEQLKKSTTTFHQPRPSELHGESDSIEATGIRKLGLIPRCPICLALAKCILSLKVTERNVKIRQVNLRWPFWGLPWHFCSPQALNFIAYVKWNETTAEGAMITKEDMTFGTIFWVMELDAPRLAHCRPNRFNPAVLKEHIKMQFQKYPEENLQSTAGYPSSFRLIDVNTRCVVNIGNEHVRYSAISYRWDSEDENMLTPKSERHFACPGSLSLQTMSQTLHDCMMIAKLLEIPYIWIDRYCIMQGDKKEKVEQIHVMGDIYANSYLTMVCAISEDMHSGIPGYKRDFHVSWGLCSTKYCVATARSLVTRGAETSEWQQRGWTMQEEYLSPRRLYFMNCNVFWHINCPMIEYHTTDFKVEIESRAECSTAKKRSVYSLIEEYSNRDLTVPTDRVDAISGLFKTRGIAHIFGVPTRRMDFGLCWNPDQPYGGPITEFPTWSWAHLRQPVCSGYWTLSLTKSKCAIFHALVPPRKRIAWAKQHGLSMALLKQLSDRQLLIRSRTRRSRTRRPRRNDLSHTYYDLFSRTPRSSVLLSLMFHSSEGTKAYLALEPFKPPGILNDDGLFDGNVMHAQRVGYSTQKLSCGCWCPFGSLAKLRPLAIQTLTTLKTQRLRNISLRRVTLAKFLWGCMSQRPISPSQQSRSISPQCRISSDQTATKIPTIGLTERKQLSKRKRFKSAEDPAPKGKKSLGLSRSTAGLDGKKALSRKSRCQNKLKPVPRPFFGWNWYKDDAASFRTIILH